MRFRAALSMALLGLAVVAPAASAQLAPAPTVLDFERAPGPIDTRPYAGAGATLRSAQNAGGFCGAGPRSRRPPRCSAAP